MRKVRRLKKKGKPVIGTHKEEGSACSGLVTQDDSLLECNGCGRLDVVGGKRPAWVSLSWYQPDDKEE